MIAHRQNVADDKTVGKVPDEIQQKSKETQPAQEQQTQMKPLESLYMELPEQPKRRAPSPPRATFDSQKSKPLDSPMSESMRSRRKAPAPPSLSRRMSGKLSTFVA